MKNEAKALIKRVESHGGGVVILNGSVALRPVPQSISIQMDFMRFCVDRKKQSALQEVLREREAIRASRVIVYEFVDSFVGIPDGYMVDEGVTFSDEVEGLERAKKAVSMLDSMVRGGESHSDKSRKVVAEVLR